MVKYGLSRALISKVINNKLCKIDEEGHNRYVSMLSVCKDTKICCNCKVEKDKSLFGNNKRYRDGKQYVCKSCIKIKNKEWNDLNGKEYYILNKETITASHVAYSRRKLKTDLIYRLRDRVSCEIRKALKKVGSSKKGHSILECLPYTIEQLKEHLESLFQPWMNWGNHGPYKINEWDDNDQSTWTWQIDHKVPQSDLIYTSMEDENFKKCWALDNLRPYQAKQNILDGVSRVRHGDKNGRD
jgi:hypothetical protein